MGDRLCAGSRTLLAPLRRRVFFRPNQVGEGATDYFLMWVLM